MCRRSTSATANATCRLAGNGGRLYRLCVVARIAASILLMSSCTGAQVALLSDTAEKSARKTIGQATKRSATKIGEISAATSLTKETQTAQQPLATAATTVAAAATTARSENNNTVKSHVEAMQWAPHAFERLVALGLETQSSLLTKFGGNRRVTTSSAFSGVGAPETADLFIEAATCRIAPNIAALTLVPLWAFEYNRKCQEELLVAACPPQHVFGNILDLCPRQYRKACGLDGGVAKDADALRDCLPRCNVKRRLWCVRCGRRCRLQYAAIHRAGSPCTDHSTFNQNRKAFSGPNAKLFFLWCALMLVTQPLVIFHDNVPSFGDEELRNQLGSHYVIIRILTCPSQLGPKFGVLAIIMILMTDD